MITFRGYFQLLSDGKTNKEIAASLNSNTKAINRILERKGYQYNREEKRWIWSGDSPEPLDEEMVFLKSGQRASVVNDSTKLASQKPDNIPVKSSTKAPSKHDAIDMILEESKEEKPFRLYKGFYWDEDIIRVLNTIQKGHRSDLLNEAVRRVFKDKGLL